MKKILIPFILFLTSCSGYMKVDDSQYQHGNVPEQNPVMKDRVVVEKDSHYAFWLVYVPILLGVSYMTWKTFRPTKKTP